MQNETSKFKWMENLEKQPLKEAVTSLSLTEKLDLINEIVESDNHSENNLKVVIVAQSQVIDELTRQLLTASKRN